MDSPPSKNESKKVRCISRSRVRRKIWGEKRKVFDNWYYNTCMSVGIKRIPKFALFASLAICVLGAYSIACGSEFPESTQTEELTILRDEPTHNVDRQTMIADSQYWNSSWEHNELFNTITAINKTYHEEHTYVEDMFDCSDMVVDIWNILLTQGIRSMIVVGNLNILDDSWAESNHVWLVVLHSVRSVNRWFAIESTSGAVRKLAGDSNYWGGFYYPSPSEFKADALAH